MRPVRVMYCVLLLSVGKCGAGSGRRGDVCLGCAVCGFGVCGVGGTRGLGGEQSIVGGIESCESGCSA